MRRLSRRYGLRGLVTLSATVLAFATVACGGGSDGPTAPTQASLAGTWDLKTVNGSNLPFTMGQLGADKVELTSSVLTVSGASFAEIYTTRETINGVVTNYSYSDAGSYTINGTAVTFTYNSGEGGTGTVSGNTFTLAEGGFSFVYQKR